MLTLLTKKKKRKKKKGTISFGEKRKCARETKEGRKADGRKISVFFASR